MSSSRVRRGRAFWESVVAEQASSGLTQEEFSRGRGLHPSTLQRWRSRLGYTAGEASRGGAAPGSEVAPAAEFVRVVVEARPRVGREGAPLPAVPAVPAAAELHLPFGAMVRCAVGTDAGWLADLVVACGRAAC
ncbi:MAG: hypothetical protein FJ255_12830 [Phycisphaerae bacterium]|nr:hypothetical protein [Phycisphaerae bacterium]MBM4398299.1 hypothetical protein [Deltaproteobacteria bacterium]